MWWKRREPVTVPVEWFEAERLDRIILAGIETVDAMLTMVRSTGSTELEEELLDLRLILMERDADARRHADRR